MGEMKAEGMSGILGPNGVLGQSGKVGVAAIQPNVLAKSSTVVEPNVLAKSSAAKSTAEPPVTSSAPRDWFDDDDVEVIDGILERIDGFLDRLIRRFR